MVIACSPRSSAVLSYRGLVAVALEQHDARYLAVQTGPLLAGIPTAPHRTTALRPSVPEL
jgi:hypothetical protein